MSAINSDNSGGVQANPKEFVEALKKRVTAH
jgi:hypothetical protein